MGTNRLVALRKEHETMKKIFAIVLAISMMTTLICMSGIGAQAASGDVFRISGQRRDGSLVEVKSTASFADGWNYAIEKAIDHDWMSDNGYVRIVADLLADWNAVDGEFGSGDGFKWDTIYIEEEAIITLNLNGHTINRGLTDWEHNGEVISVDDEADVIINGGKNAEDTQTGTITGGFSCNGGGGIHVEEDVKITLNNVNIDDNAVEDDLGAAIHILDGSTLIMNGGSIANNRLQSGSLTIAPDTDGTVYIEDADATFNKVTFSGNICEDQRYQGMAIFATGDSDVTLNECTVEKYGYFVDGKDNLRPNSLFYCEEEKVQLTLNKCTISDNSSNHGIISDNVVVNECIFTENIVYYGFFYLDHTSSKNIKINNSVFADNITRIIDTLDTDGEEKSKIYVTGCTFNYNGTQDDYTIKGDSRVDMKFVDCEFDDRTVFKGKEHITFVDTNAANGAEDKKDSGIGSVIGEGSLTTIVAFLALFISLAAVSAIAVSNKKKVALKTGANNTIDD